MLGFSSIDDGPLQTHFRKHEDLSPITYHCQVFILKTIKNSNKKMFILHKRKKGFLMPEEVCRKWTKSLIFLN